MDDGNSLPTKDAVGENRAVDERLDVLAHEDRRRLLSALLEGEGPMSMGDGESNAVVPGGEVVMRHRHLPKLDGLGLVEWDREAGRVTSGPRLDEVEPLLAVLSEYGNAAGD